MSTVPHRPAEGSGPLKAPPNLKGQVWDLMSKLLKGVLDDASTAVRLRRVDLEAFDKKLKELGSMEASAAQGSLLRLTERRRALEEEIAGLEKHVDDFRFLARSLEELKAEAQRRDELQTESLQQIASLEDTRTQQELEIVRLRQDVARLVSENDELSRGMENVGRVQQGLQGDYERIRLDKAELEGRLGELVQEVATLTQVLDVVTGQSGDAAPLPAGMFAATQVDFKPPTGAASDVSTEVDVNLDDESFDVDLD